MHIWWKTTKSLYWSFLSFFCLLFWPYLSNYIIGPRLRNSHVTTFPEFPETGKYILTVCGLTSVHSCIQTKICTKCSLFLWPGHKCLHYSSHHSIGGYTKYELDADQFYHRVMIRFFCTIILKIVWKVSKNKAPVWMLTFF